MAAKFGTAFFVTLGTTILPCELISLEVRTFSNKTLAPSSAHDLAPGNVLSAEGFVSKAAEGVADGPLNVHTC